MMVVLVEMMLVVMVVMAIVCSAAERKLGRCCCCCGGGGGCRRIGSSRCQDLIALDSGLGFKLFHEQTEQILGGRRQVFIVAGNHWGSDEAVIVGKHVGVIRIRSFLGVWTGGFNNDARGLYIGYRDGRRD